MFLFMVVVVNGQRQGNQDIGEPVVEFDQAQITKEQPEESSFRKGKVLNNYAMVITYITY